MKHDIAKLEKRLKAFDTKVAAFESLSGALIPIIHGPGWTTLPEYNLVMLAMDALDRHVDSIGHLQSTLVQVAQQIGKVPVAA